MAKPGLEAAPETSWSISRLSATPEGVAIREIRELDEPGYERLGDSLASLSRSTPLDVFRIVSQNMEAVDALQATLARRMAGSMPKPNRSEHFVATAHFSTRVLSVLSNYLSAGRMYTDSVSDILSSAYGKTSPEYEGFTADLAALFDDSAGYRFTYHLRNALQHVGSLPLSITESVSTSPDEQVRIAVDRDRLLAAYKWHKKVRSDLLDGQEVVDLLPLLRGGYTGYLWLERRRVRRCLEQQREQVAELAKIVGEMHEDGSSLLLVRLRRQPDPTPDSQMKLDQRVFPNPRFLEAVIAAYGTGDFDLVLPEGYQRPQAGSRKSVVDGVLLGPALDLLDAQYAGGQATVAREIGRTILDGPQASATLISSLLNVSMITLSQVEMAIGQSIESQLCSWRGSPSDVDGLQLDED